MWSPKGKDEEIDYAFDFTSSLKKLADVIGTVSVTSETPAGAESIVIGSISNTDYIVRVYLKGGSSGQAYAVKCKIITFGGSAEPRTLTLVGNLSIL